MISERALNQSSALKCGLVAGVGFGTLAAFYTLCAPPPRTPVTSVKDAVLGELAKIKPLEHHVEQLRLLCQEPKSDARNKEIAILMQDAQKTVSRTHEFTSKRFPQWTAFLTA